MFKKIIFCFLLIFITGCDQDFIGNRSKNNTKTTANSSFEWVEINKSAIQTKIYQSFKKIHPYPKEIDKDINELRRRNIQIQTEINKINKENTKKCIDVASKNIDGKHEKKSINIYKNTLYAECIENARKDDLLVDLKAKKTKIASIYNARSDHDRMIRKQANDMIELAIPKYAEKNGYQLIVSKQLNSVIYNQGKIVIDVTADVIDYILKNRDNLQKEKIE